MTSRSWIVLAVQRLILRSGRTPLGRVWRPAYRAMARAATAYLSRGEPGATAYLRGGVGADDFQPGLSDVDTAVVLAEDPAGPGVADGRARRRWRRLARVMPLIESVVEGPMVYERAVLRDLAGASAFTYGLDRSGEPAPRRAAYHGRHATLDARVMLERPGLYAAETAGWRLLAGSDRRQPESPRDPQHRRIAAWLELLFWWRWVFPVCIDPTGPRTAALCVKLVAEPTRIWLWLAHGERVSGRVDVLRAGIRRMPEEEDALRRALDLHLSLHRSPDPPLADALPALVRLSARIAELLGAEVRDGDATEVRLAGADPAQLILPDGGRPPPRSRAGRRELRLLPLADWRALACPPLADESFALLDDDPGDPAAVGAAAAQDAGPYPALRRDGLMVLPAGTLRRTGLRAIKCPAADPVPFAVAEGAGVASFPNVSGWSAEDTARRAVAEHCGWLRTTTEIEGASNEGHGKGGPLSMLLTAARAALFLESVREGAPELSLTVTETARQLGERSPAARTIAEEALESHRGFAVRRAPPPPETVAAMRKLVLALPAYSGPAARRRE